MSSSTASSGFAAFGLKASVLKVLAAKGYTEPTPIQTQSIPSLLEGRDVLGQAATGTGKTAAFALPIIERLKSGPRVSFQPQALVLVPTRELAMQVAEAVTQYGQEQGVSVLAVFGGQEFHHQFRPLKRGVDVVVATPGRALDHLRRKTLSLKDVHFVVLDEADEMLDMGFAEDLDTILSELPEKRQTALFSATLPSRIASLAEKHLKNPVRVNIAARSVDAGTLPKIRQAAYVVARGQKEAALVRVMETENPARALVFCRTRLDVDALTQGMNGHGYPAAALHGGLTQEQRDLVLKRFKAGNLRVLVATDVAARGIHVDQLSHVINYDLPTSPEPYVHRIGRTGRAGNEGVALSFLEVKEMRMLKNIERVMKMPIPIVTVPTPAQLRARRRAQVASLVTDAMTAPDVGEWAELVKTLSGQGGAEKLAAAALRLLQAKLFPETATDAVELSRSEVPKRHAQAQRPSEPRRAPAPRASVPRAPRASSPRAPRASSPRAPRVSAPRAPRVSSPRAPRTTAPRLTAAAESRMHAPPPKAASHPRAPYAPKAGAPRGQHDKRSDIEFSWLYITLGSQAGVRPQDVVGAIANEAKVASNRLGQIVISDKGARVEVPKVDAPKIIEALRLTKIRGRKFGVGYDTSNAGFAPRSARR